ncbi:MFS transporter [Caballeronia mineralivorans]|uniref:MFS transporter n=1 Tax=Caballeronia mineralivorans TaxID=2010198 RepID=UPI0023F304AE|nr:MFS transporter [Caballeronia mineralivorans]MDB5784915.1 Major facilitator transporter [Caballeronia mineralivorans]
MRQRSTNASPTAPRSARGKTLVLIAVILACVSLPLSLSAGPAAQTFISRDLAGGTVALSWITNAFMLACGSTLMVAGALADHYGRKKIFFVGMLVMTVVSLLMPLAPSVLWLDFLRVPHGLAAACAYAGGVSMLAQEFEGPARVRIFSLIGIAFGAGLAFGPTLAGILIAFSSWHAVFLSSALISFIALILCIFCMRDSKNSATHGLDWAGAGTFTLMLTLFTFAVVEAPVHGWTSSLVLGLFVASALVLVLFVVIEMKVLNPMLDLSLFRYPRFVGAQLLPLATAYSYIALLVILPLRFIGIEGLNALDAGILMLYFSAPLLFIPFLSAMLTRFIPVGILSGLGMLISVAGLFLLTQVPLGDHGILMRVDLLLIGLGAAIPWGLMDNLAVSVVPSDKAGMAVGIFGALRVSIDSTAMAIVGSLLAFFAQQTLTDIGPDQNPDTLASGAAQLAAGTLAKAGSILSGFDHAHLLLAYDLAFKKLLWVAIILTLAAAILVFALLGRVRSDHGEVAGAKEDEARREVSAPLAQESPALD